MVEVIKLAEHGRAHRWLVECDVTDAQIGLCVQQVVARIPAPDAERFPDVEVHEVSCVPATTSGAYVREASLGLMEIVLSPRQLKEAARGDDAALRGMIAHELAHALLRHPAEDDDGCGGLLHERRADEKAREWVGTDVDAFRGTFGPPTVE